MDMEGGRGGRTCLLLVHGLCATNWRKRKTSQLFLGVSKHLRPAPCRPRALWHGRSYRPGLLNDRSLKLRQRAQQTQHQFGDWGGIFRIGLPLFEELPRHPFADQFINNDVQIRQLTRAPIHRS